MYQNIRLKNIKRVQLKNNVYYVDDKKDVNLDVDYVMETDVNELLTKMISIAICYQIKVFEYFLQCAKKYNKYINVHTKGCEELILNLVK